MKPPARRIPLFFVRRLLKDTQLITRNCSTIPFFALEVQPFFSLYMAQSVCEPVSASRSLLALCELCWAALAPRGIISAQLVIASISYSTESANMMVPQKIISIIR